MGFHGVQGKDRGRSRLKAYSRSRSAILETPKSDADLSWTGILMRGEHAQGQRAEKQRDMTGWMEGQRARRDGRGKEKEEEKESEKEKGQERGQEERKRVGGAWWRNDGGGRISPAD